MTPQVIELALTTVQQSAPRHDRAASGCVGGSTKCSQGSHRSPIRAPWRSSVATRPNAWPLRSVRPAVSELVSALFHYRFER